MCRFLGLVFLCFFPAVSFGRPFKHTVGAWFWARPFVTTLSHSKTPLRLLYKRTLLTLPWTPRNSSPSILYCAVIDWDCLNKLFWYILVWFNFWAVARLFLEFVAQRSLNFQAAAISRFPNLLITVCAAENNYNACFQAFVGSSGWCFVIFLAISLRMPFKKLFAIWGLILGPCFCRSPFLWRAIDFRFLLSRFRYFLWILEFLLLLLLFFSTSLLFCVFALLFSACMCFLLFRYFVFSCFSASLLFLLLSVLLPCFFSFFFLLRCFSTSLPFYFYLSFSAVMHFHDIS